MRRARPLAALRDPWVAGGVGITALLVILAAVVGLIVLPLYQPGVRYAGIWDAICSAAGVLRPPPSVASIVLPNVPTTQVAVTPQMLRRTDAESIGRGATLALRCTMCHGARGLSEANSPNLAGQYAAVVYKELRDFQSSARASAVMTPLVAGLSERDMRDLAAYYAYLPRLPAYHPTGGGPPPRILLSGAPMRNIPPCGACHGELSNKTGSPWLEGQPEAYLLAQLQAFATGARRNDIDAQMRNVARGMTAAEIDTAATWYASHPEPLP
jgi:cytochrome c553